MSERSPSFRQFDEPVAATVPMDVRIVIEYQACTGRQADILSGRFVCNPATDGRNGPSLGLSRPGILMRKQRFVNLHQKFCHTTIAVATASRWLYEPETRSERSKAGHCGGSAGRILRVGGLPQPAIEIRLRPAESGCFGRGQRSSGRKHDQGRRHKDCALSSR